MDTFDRKIQELQKERAQTEAQRNELLSQLGLEICQQDSSWLESRSLHTEAEQVNLVRDRLTHTQRQLHEIEALMEQQQSLKSQSKVLKRRREDLDRRLAPALPVLGEAAWTLYANGAPALSPYASYFKDIETHVAEQHILENRLDETRLKPEETGFWAGLSVSARRFYLHLSARLKDGQLKQLFSKAGRDLMTSPVLDLLDRPELKEALHLVLQQRGPLLALSAEQTNIEAEITETSRRLSLICGEVKAEILQSETSKTLKSQEAELQVRARALAQSYLSLTKPKNPKTKALDWSGKALEETLAESERQLQRLGAELEQWQAAREIRDLEKQNETLQQRVASMEAQIDRIRQDQAELARRQGENRNRIQTLEALRGPLNLS